jgi:hypothetical protein
MKAKGDKSSFRPSSAWAFALIKVAQGMMHATVITSYSRHTTITVPRLSVLITNHEPSGEDVGSASDAFQKAPFAEPVVVAPAPVVLKKHSVRRDCAIFLTEQSVVSGDSIRSEEQEGEALGTMFFVVTRVAFEHGDKRIRIDQPPAVRARQLRSFDMRM